MGSGLLADLRHALRLYRRTSGASLVVVGVLAISMALVAAFLSLYSDLTLRPERGFEPGGRVISIGWNDGRNAGGLPLEFVDRLAGEVVTLDHVAGVSRIVFAAGSDQSYSLGEVVTREFFEGVRPKLALGRGFSEAEHDEQGEPVVVISWRYWQEHYAGSPDVLGRVLQIERMTTPFEVQQEGAEDEQPPKDFRIVGVMAADFTGIEPPMVTGDSTGFWLPVERALSIFPAARREQMRRSMALRTVARRSAGVSSEAVLHELTGRYAEEEFLARRAGARFDVLGRIVQNVHVQRAAERQLRLFLAASVLLALVATANVSLFLLARAPGRRRELGIRMAVGAPLKRLVRQLVTESAVLVLAAIPIGLVLSVWLAGYLRQLPFLREAQWRDVTLFDWRVLVLVGAFLLVVVLLVSLAPVLGLKKLGIAASGRQVAARASFAQRLAGTAQVAIASALGGAAIAFGWYLATLMLSWPGYRTDNLYAVPYTMAFRIRMENGQPVSEGGIVENAHKRQALEAIAGVRSVSLSGAVPGVESPGGGTSVGTVPDPEAPDQPVRVRTVAIDGNFVRMLGLKIVHGRNITEDDVGGALVNQTFARRFFGREDVAGEPIPSASLSTRGYAAAQPTHILGVIEDFSFGHPLADIDPMVLAATGSATGGVILVESELPLAALQRQLRDTALALELTPTSNAVSLAGARAIILAPDRARAFLTIATALIVVLVAAFGFYGTQRYLVSAGLREYAIRAALGAGPRALGHLVLKRGLLLALPGLVFGALLAFILVAWMRDEYISRGTSPLGVTAVAVAGLLVIVLTASVGPARLARRTQPAPLLQEQ